MDIFLINRYKVDPRRVPELKDARLIQEDGNAMSNCPTTPIHREFHHSYVNPYDDNAAIHPIPHPRRRKFADDEDMKSYRANQKAAF